MPLSSRSAALVSLAVSRLSRRQALLWSIACVAGTIAPGGVGEVGAGLGEFAFDGVVRKPPPFDFGEKV